MLVVAKYCNLPGVSFRIYGMSFRNTSIAFPKFIWKFFRSSVICCKTGGKSDEPLPILLTSSSSTTRIADNGSLLIMVEDSTSRPRSRRTCDSRLVGVWGVKPTVGATQQVLNARVDSSRLFIRTMVAACFFNCVNCELFSIAFVTTIIYDTNSEKIQYVDV